MSDVPVGVEVSTTAGVCVVSFRDGTVFDSLSVQQIGRQLYALADEPPRGTYSSIVRTSGFCRHRRWGC
jgi:hypothetical protein